MDRRNQSQYHWPRVSVEQLSQLFPAPTDHAKIEAASFNVCDMIRKANSKAREGEAPAEPGRQ